MPESGFSSATSFWLNIYHVDFIMKIAPQFFESCVINVIALLLVETTVIQKHISPKYFSSSRKYNGPSVMVHETCLKHSHV